MKYVLSYAISFLLVTIIGQTGYSQQKFTISGYVQDAETGEKLINAKVFDKTTAQGVITNSYGFFSLTLPEGQVSIVAAYAGYQSFVLDFELNQDSEMQFELEYYKTEEVEIVAEEQVRIEEQTEMSTISIPVEQIKLLPALLGEVDVIKAVQLLPGVQSGSEGTTGLYVRGGGPDQNLILLDDVPLYYVSHLGGFFSVFNADALSNVKLIKGGFPSRYGGRLSSVLDIRMKEGNMNKFVVDGTIGLVSSKLSVQGPIIPNKTSFMISARRTYLDLFTRPLSQIISRASSDGEGSLSFGYYFYDLNGKINHIISAKDRLFFSFYLGDDDLGFNIKNQSGLVGEPDFFESKIKSSVRWGNRLAALRWNHIWTPKLFSNLTATFTDYRFRVNNDFQEARAISNGEDLAISQGLLNYRSGIQDAGAKLDFDFYPNPNHDIKFGALLTHHTFTPGLFGFNISAGDSTILDTALSPDLSRGIEGGLYIENRMKLGSRFSANVGVRGSFYRVNDVNYAFLEPRISSRFLVSDRLSLKSSFVQMNQYLHLLTTSGSGLPIDLWVPATDRVAPQRSWQAAIGAAATLGDGKYEFSVEGYYKQMSGLIEYKEGTNFFLSFEDRWEDRVEANGTGEAYGVEVLFQKKKGKTTGWAGYTLAWNNRQFANINQGNVYPYKYDRRHDIGIVVAHRVKEGVTLSGTWVFGTGNALTMPTGGYASLQQDVQRFLPQFDWTFYNYGNGQFGSGGGIQLYEEGRNNFRMAAYHRLDIGFNFTKQKKWGERTWSVGVYNLYARQNPYTYFLDSVPDPANGANSFKPELRRISLFPFPIPFISYSFHFEKTLPNR
ncbi:MAG: carboxypeptidase-like regulatory domain-containing protein [Bacteroidota bacterium]